MVKQKRPQKKHYRNEGAITDLGEMVRQLRREKNMSLEEMCAAADKYVEEGELEMHPTQLGRIERGETNVSISYIVLLAKIFGITPSELLDFSKLKKEH